MRLPPCWIMVCRSRGTMIALSAAGLTGTTTALEEISEDTKKKATINTRLSPGVAGIIVTDWLARRQKKLN